MAVLALNCDGLADRVQMPSRDQLQAAIERFDYSIWLEADGGNNLSAVCLDAKSMNLGDAFEQSCDDGKSWLVRQLFEPDGAAVLRFNEADYVPTYVAKAAALDWFDRNTTRNNHPLQWTGPGQWIS